MRAAGALVVLTACGRIAFDPSSGALDGAADQLTGTSAFGTHGGAGSQKGSDLAAGPDGAITLVGAFENTIDFGAPWTSHGGYDAIVTRLSPTGIPIWALQIGGSGDDRASAVGIDGANNTYVTGIFNGAVDFGGGTLTALGEADIFVASYSVTGAYRWARRFGGTVTSSPFGSDWGYAIAVNPSGNVYVGGQFSGTTDFGTGSVTSTSVDYDAFLLALDADGNTRWFKKLGAAGTAKVSALAATASGVYATGYQHGGINFGGGAVATNGIHDVFVVGYSSAGAFQFANGYGGSGIDWGRTIAVDPVGEVYVAGSYQTTVDFGSGPQTTTSESDGFVMSLTAGGGYRWSRAFHAVCSRSESLTVDPGGRIVLTGVFDTSMDPGGGMITSDGPADAFVARYLSGGTVEKQVRLGGPGYDEGRSVAATAAGIYLTGTIDGGNECPDYGSLVDAPDLFLVLTETP